MIQMMEDAWFVLSLKGHHDLPMNRGWMNVFRRWSNTRAFHRLWPALRSEFSGEFVQFCEAQLHLTVRDDHQRLDRVNIGRLRRGRTPDELIRCVHPDPVHASLLALDAEFAREWPEEAGQGRGLVDRIVRACPLDAHRSAIVRGCRKYPRARVTFFRLGSRRASG